ncbi:MAG: PSD1 domain-containing protein [Bryobacterales bacterium]|nr:PSD1 domain-containing protein [Bryobacterales bacterium]
MTRCTHLLGLLSFLSVSLMGGELEQQAYNILQKNCFGCHGAGLKTSNLDLRTREAAIAGGERGEAIVPNYPERSRAYLFAAHAQKPAMPPGGKLAEAEVDILERWIRAGAVYPAAEAVKEDDAARKAALAAMEERPVTEKERAFWSFRKPVRPQVPKNGEANPIDAFLRAGWQEKQLTPSKAAERRTLIRRVYLDVLGLPPTPQQVNAFLNDASPKAWENLVDTLLASPHYGERWARHWLDLVRYADSGGFEYDRDYKQIWRYRDWVVKAFNTNLPYDRFLKLQLAGDEYEPANAEAVVATGFLRLGPENNIKTEQTRMDELDDIVSTTSLSFLGMTLGCARCHNHKFDPIPQKDYYRIQSVFYSTRPREFPLVSTTEVERYKAEMKRVDGLVKPLAQRKEAIEKPYREQIFAERVAKLPEYMQLAWKTPADKRTEGQRLNARQIERTLQIEEKEILERMSAADRAEHKKLTAEVEALRKKRPEEYETAMVIGEEGREALPSYFLHRGSPGSKGSEMKPGVLTVAAEAEPVFPAPPENATTSHRRRGFADWVASPHNPLTARVMVNRIWQHHFGDGIVATPSNFGKTGMRPSNQPLLDWLATEFVASGWDMKHMHRLMLTSKAYRMASDDIDSNLKTDPRNRALWRMPRQRLEAEALRDAMFAVAGTLDLSHGGPAVLPYIDPALFQGSSKRTWNGKAEEDRTTWRRSLYVFNKRSIRYPLFESFDQPDMITSCARRNTSTTAPQALLLMNNAMVRMQAAAFAERLRKEAGDDRSAQIKRAFELALMRPPSPGEMDHASSFLTKGGELALAEFCQTLFNTNEFAFIP